MVHAQRNAEEGQEENLGQKRRSKNTEGFAMEKPLEPIFVKTVQVKD